MTEMAWEIRRRAEDRIWRAWYAALISGVGGLLLTFWASRGPADDPRHVVISVDAVLTVLLGWLVGRYRSRVAACLLVLRSIGFGTAMLGTGAILAGVVSLAVFLPMYGYGLIAARDLQRLASGDSRSR